MTDRCSQATPGVSRLGRILSYCQTGQLLCTGPRNKFKFLLLLSKGFELCFSSLLPWESLYPLRTCRTNLHSEGRALALVFPAPTYAGSFTPRIGKGIMVNLIVCAQAVSVSFSG